MNSDILALSPFTLTLIWLALFIILIIIEICTVSLTTIWFAGGSLGALLANVLGANIYVQIFVFFAVSCILLVCTRPWAVKYLNGKRTKTNYESEIGRIIKLTQRVDNINETGKSIVNGQEWTVRSADDKIVLEEGQLARVVAVSGVKLIVEEYKEGAENE